MRKWASTLLLCLPLAAHAAVLPDIGRGVQALEAGRLDQAEKNLLPLAQRGFVDAQHYLARLYKQVGTEATRDEAIRWYEQSVSKYPLDADPLGRLRFEATRDPQHLLGVEQMLLQQREFGNPDALKRLVRLYRDFPGLADDDKIGDVLGAALATDDPDNIAAVIDWYRKNDGVRENFVQLIQLCARHYRRVDDCLPDLALNARMGRNPERVTELVDQALARYPSERVDAGLLYDMASRLLTNNVPQPPMQADAIELLEAASSRHLPALARLGEILTDRPDLIEDANPIEMLEQAHAAGSADAALTLGRAYMNGTLVEIDPSRAEQYLSEASETLPAGKFSLARFYMRGFAGDDEYVRAAPLLLDAARAGYQRADLDLARFYAENRVVQANPAYAFAFARIAQRNEVSGVAEFLNQLQPRLTDDMVAQGNSVAEKVFEAPRYRNEPMLGLALNQESGATASESTLKDGETQ